MCEPVVTDFRTATEGTELFEIRFDCFGHPRYECVCHGSLPRNEVFVPWRVDRPRGDKRVFGNTADCPAGTVEWDRIVVCLRRHRDSDVLLAAEWMRIVVDDEPRPLARLSEFERVDTRTTSPRVGCIYVSAPPRSLGCDSDGAASSHAAESIPPSSALSRSVVVCRSYASSTRSWSSVIAQ